MKGLLFLILGATITTNAVAGGCDWATETPADDGKYKYFVGRGYSEKSLEKAAKQAEQDIDAQLGRVFGSILDVRSDFYSDETGNTATTRSYERVIGTITLKGLERQKSDKQKKSGVWESCVLYRYSIKEFETEKKRLKSMSAAELKKSLVFNEVTGDIECRGAPVEIVTMPSGAYVTIDNGKYQGTSPIKFGNVCNGKHTLEITHDNYEFLSEKLIVPSSGRIEKTLKRATKKITVKTTLGNSQIEINGVNKGKEPVTFDAPLGIEHSFTTINEESGTITRNRIFSKESDSVFVIHLDKLPGKIDFSAFKKRNPGVEIYVDGKKLAEDSTKEILAGYHSLTFKKEGYNDREYTFNILGGKTTYYPSQEMVFTKTVKQPKYNAYSPTKWETFFGFGAGISLGNFGFNLDINLEKSYGWFYSNLGLQLNYIFMDSIAYKHDYYSYEEELYLEFFEFFYADLGLNLSEKYSVFGVISFGTLMMDDYLNTKSIAMTRYGIGIRYLFNKHSGVRLTYQTGDTGITIDDIYDSISDSYYYGGINTDNIPEKLATFNMTWFVRF